MKKVIFALGILWSCELNAQNVKSFATTSNPLDSFTGYKVDTVSLKLSRKNDFGKSYWLNTEVFSDINVAIFQKNYEVYAPPQGEAYCVFSTGIVNGDFNNDGYIDVFNAGAAFGGKKANLSFLIWNPNIKKFEEKNLINNKTNFLGNPAKVTPMYLNNDNYVDLIIQGGPDEGYPNLHPSPVTLCLSDGKGGYDLSNLTLEPDALYNNNGHEKGDAADVNGDGYPDLTIPTGPHTYIFWGVQNYPYFTNQNFAHFSSDTVNYTSNNGFGEVVSEGAGDVYASHFADINGDGLLDLLLGGSEDSTSHKHQRILLNQGNGKFNKNGLINLPLFTNVPNYKPNTNNGINQFDYVTDDLNGDGLTDIISLNATNYKYWYILIYIQQQDKSFKIDTSWIVYNSHYLSPNPVWKFVLKYHDFNGDGKKDISYEDASIEAFTDSTNTFSRKTVFIRTGSSFIEKDFYQFDPYAKYILDSIKNKPSCPQSYLRKPIFNSFVKSFCPGDSLKVSMTLDLKIDNILKGDSLKWYFGGKSDLTNVTSKTFTDSLKFFVIRKDSLGCTISSDTIQLTKYALPAAPTLSRDTDNSLLSSVSSTTWYKDGVKLSDTTKKYKPIAPGSYTVKTTSNGCASLFSIPYYYLVTDVINLNADEFIKLSPNPFSNQLNFDFVVKGYQRLNLEVFDLATGWKVASKQNLIAGIPIYLSELSAGTYVIKVTSNDNKISYQFKMVKL